MEMSTYQRQAVLSAVTTWAATPTVTGPFMACIFHMAATKEVDIHGLIDCALEPLRPRTCPRE